MHNVILHLNGIKQLNKYGDSKQVQNSEQAETYQPPVIEVVISPQAVSKAEQI